MHSTNYRNTLITVATDSPVRTAVPPDKPGTIAFLQYEMLNSRPQSLTSDDLLLAVQGRRNGPTDRAEFFSKPQACLRTSPLVKRHGFGLHHDDQSRVTLIAMGSELYTRLLGDPAVEKVPGMRSTRAR